MRISVTCSIGVQILISGLSIGNVCLTGAGYGVILGESTDNRLTLTPYSTEGSGHLSASFLNSPAIFSEELDIGCGGLVLPEGGFSVVPYLHVEI